MKVPSRAELGHFDFRAENELDFFFDILLFLIQFSFFAPKISYFKKKQSHLQQNKVKIILFLLKMTNFWGEKRKLKQKKLYIKEKIQLVFSSKIKVPQLGSARLGTFIAWARSSRKNPA